MSFVPSNSKQAGVDKYTKGKMDLELLDTENESGDGGSHMDECYICDDGGGETSEVIFIIFLFILFFLYCGNTISSIYIWWIACSSFQT